MFQLKLEYLSDQNLSLKRQIRDLKHILSVQSQQNQKSLLFQVRESNQQLSSALQQVKDELLLQRSAREIERNQHSSIVQQLNRCVFELKQEISILEDILRRQQTAQTLNPIEKLFRRDRKDKAEVLHKYGYANPVLFFQIVENLLDYLENSQNFVDSEEEEVLSERLEPLEASDLFETSEHKLIRNASVLELVARNSGKYQNESKPGKWLSQRSSIYFLRKNRKENLHICLAKAKILQLQCMKEDQKEQKKQPHLTKNVQLLKRSYVELIGDYQILKNKYRRVLRYVEELQQRNQLLLESRMGKFL